MERTTKAGTKSMYLTEKTIKDTLKIEEKPLVRVNIRYPEAPEDFFGGKEKEFNDFSFSLARAFLSFAGGKLLQKAKSQSPDEPYGAVMTWIESFVSPELVCCVVDAFIYSDGKRSDTSRVASTWSRTSGHPMTKNDFFTKQGIIRLRSMLDPATSRNGDFFLCEKGYGFSLNDAKAEIIPFGSLGDDEKITAKN